MQSPRPARGVLFAGTALALAISSGCAGSRALPLGDGLYKVDCPGGYHNWSACFTAANRQCGRTGYQIVAQISDEGAAVGSQDWSQAGSEVSRSMEFRCN